MPTTLSSKHKHIVCVCVCARVNILALGERRERYEVYVIGGLDSSAG